MVLCYNYEEKGDNMQLNNLKKILEYKSVPDMLKIVNITYKNINRIKATNPDRYRLIINDIIMQHHAIDTNDLLKLMELKKNLKEFSKKA